MFSNNLMFVNVVTLSLSGYTIDHKDTNHKIEVFFFSSNGINSKMSFFCKRYLTPPLVRSIRHPPPLLVLPLCLAQCTFLG